MPRRKRSGYASISVLAPLAIATGSRAQVFAIPVATMSVFVAASRRPAWAKISLLPSDSWIQSTGKPRVSSSRANLPASAAVIRSGSADHTPTRPRRVATSRAVIIGCAHSPIHQAVPLRDHQLERRVGGGVAREGATHRGAWVRHAPRHRPSDPAAPADPVDGRGPRGDDTPSRREVRLLQRLP